MRREQAGLFGRGLEPGPQRLPAGGRDAVVALLLGDDDLADEPRGALGQLRDTRVMGQIDRHRTGLLTG